MRDLTLALAGNPSKKKFNLLASTHRWNLAIIAAILLLGLFYLFLLNSLGTKGYAIRKLEQRVRILEEAQRSLQVQATDLQSINRIKAHAQKLNLVPATNVAYLKASDLALK